MTRQLTSPSIPKTAPHARDSFTTTWVCVSEGNFRNGRKWRPSPSWDDDCTAWASEVPCTHTVTLRLTNYDTLGMNAAQLVMGCSVCVVGKIFVREKIAPLFENLCRTRHIPIPISHWIRLRIHHRRCSIVLELSRIIQYLFIYAEWHCLRDDQESFGTIDESKLTDRRRHPMREMYIFGGDGAKQCVHATATIRRSCEMFRALDAVLVSRTKWTLADIHTSTSHTHTHPCLCWSRRMRNILAT